YLSLQERCAQDLGIEAPAVESPPRARARQPHLGGTEQKRIDLVEIAFVAIKNVDEWRPIVGRRRCGQLRGQRLELRVRRVDEEPRLPAIQYAVVGPADGLEIIRRLRRDGR